MELLAHKEGNSFEKIADDLSSKGYAVIDHFLDDVPCAGILSELQQALNEGNFHKAGVGKADDYKVIHTLRGDYIHWLEPSDEHPFTNIYLDKLEELRIFLNRACYLGLQDMEVHMTQYPAGTGYAKHVDAFHQDDNRRISVVFYLNFDWKEEDNGKLLLYPEGVEVVEILPLAGRVALFESTLAHEVLPGARKRYSITGWMLKEKRFF